MSEIKEIPEIFRYTSPEVPDDCIHKISPSQIDKFFSVPKNYYLENIMYGDREFQGNTATVLGTICHYIYECVTKGISTNRDTINDSLKIFNKMKPELNLDIDDIMISYPHITHAVVNQYLLPANQTGCLLKTEEPVVIEISDGVYLAGTCDRIEGDCIVDFKTVSKKPDENEIPWNYKLQLLAYAYAFRKKGYEINRIKLVYGVKPTKTLPSRCYPVPYTITYADEKMIEDTLNLIAESVVICRNRPELAYLIFKSYDLKKD